ncbi:MAG: hypothetical protein HUJ26_04870 [Planctomycetaceae bacterium]|nr:hypothetical protein [Planctomycetaceae bacterium]
MRAGTLNHSLSVSVIIVLCAMPTYDQLHAGEREAAEELLSRIHVNQEGSSSKDDLAEAIRQIPFKNLTATQQQEVRQVINSCDLFRRLPTLSFEVDPSVYRYFTHHPDVIVSIWRALNVSDFKMKQTGAKDYEADSGDGTLGVLEVLYRDDDQQVILCNGEMKSPVLKRRIRSQAVLHLVNVYSTDRTGRTFVTHRLDMFVAIPNQGFGAAAKLTKPFSSVIIDRNFREVSLFVQMMSLAMRHQPDWVEDLTGKMDGILAIRKKELIDLTAHVFVTNQERQQSNAAEAGEEERTVAAQPLDISAMK